METVLVQFRFRISDRELSIPKIPLSGAVLANLVTTWMLVLTTNICKNRFSIFPITLKCLIKFRICLFIFNFHRYFNILEWALKNFQNQKQLDCENASPLTRTQHPRVQQNKVMCIRAFQF